MLTEEEIKSFLAGKGNGDAQIRKVQFPTLGPARGMDRLKTGLSHLDDVQIELSVVLGQANLKVREVLALAEDSVIKLDKAVGDAVDIVMNQHRFARGEVIIINDFFGVRLSNINRAQKARLNEELI